MAKRVEIHPIIQIVSPNGRTEKMLDSLWILLKIYT